MKKSYHSREVPIRLATMTRRTDDGGGVVWRSSLRAIGFSSLLDGSAPRPQSQTPGTPDVSVPATPCEKPAERRILARVARSHESSAILRIRRHTVRDHGTALTQWPLGSHGRVLRRLALRLCVDRCADDDQQHG